MTDCITAQRKHWDMYFYFITIKWKHYSACREIEEVALIKVTAWDRLIRLLWHFVAQQTKTHDLCCKLWLCNRATALPDVSEVILSQCLMEEYTPASNNSQPSCLLQGTITDLITCAVRTLKFTPCRAHRGHILIINRQRKCSYSLKDIIIFSF